MQSTEGNNGQAEKALKEVPESARTRRGSLRAIAGLLAALVSGSTAAAPPPWEAWLDPREMPRLPAGDQVLLRSSHCPDGCRFDRTSEGDTRFLRSENGEAVISRNPARAEKAALILIDGAQQDIEQVLASRRKLPLAWTMRVSSVNRAGSIVGSGTVSNKDWAKGYSCIAEKRAIDASQSTDPLRFTNHSCRPNASLRIRQGRVEFYAMRDLAPGEEITVDYGETHHDGKLRCRCGAPGCVGFL